MSDSPSDMVTVALVDGRIVVETYGTPMLLVRALLGAAGGICDIGCQPYELRSEHVHVEAADLPWAAVADDDDE